MIRLKLNLCATDCSASDKWITNLSPDFDRVKIQKWLTRKMTIVERHRSTSPIRALRILEWMPTKLCIKDKQISSSLFNQWKHMLFFSCLEEVDQRSWVVQKTRPKSDEAKTQSQEVSESGHQSFLWRVCLRSWRYREVPKDYIHQSTDNTYSPQKM